MSSSSPGAVAWGEALDRLESDLAATEEALEHGGREPRRTVPELLSQFPEAPMPAELAPRAEELLHRTRRLEARATGEIESIGQTLRSLAGRRTAPPQHTGHIVDFDA